ncbi:LRR receptor-like serine/threonine-protein kinase isoform 1 [Theobroma cacao]|uniref:LRR receptor-like serine/threonine-protein kinase isoform 1 n=1 Tax=Theobroma cacao TaxID=3641 RepID=A0A061ES08_THECC|nr:LRR receptor-like serine/threonine-protein kinase isoform 1 [Theobroma cacao]
MYLSSCIPVDSRVHLSSGIELFWGRQSSRFPRQAKDMKLTSCFSNCFSSASETAIDRGGPGKMLGVFISFFFLLSAYTEAEEENDQNFTVFSYSELKAATHGFSASNKIGEGAFGSVYKGLLRNGIVVAVKMLSVELESMRGEREFVSEIITLSNLKHENLVTLKGCCVDGANRFLVYNYMENNSLAQILLGGEQNRIKLGWEPRRAISLGVARGLAYLHEEAKPHIVHRDIKASNILLDQNLIPKVSDFGLSRILRDNVTHISTHVAGTLGYLAPEYAISGRLTRKTDVYSFGVLLLEIISGQTVVNYDLEHGERYLVQKVMLLEAWELYRANSILQLVDPIVGMNYPEEEAVRFIKVGLLCAQETAKLRPEMSRAVRMLTNDIDIEGVQISQPGLVSDLMNIKLGQKTTFPSISSKASSMESSRSPPSSYS